MDKQELELKINEGLSQKKLANYFNVSTGTIIYWLNKYELKTLNLKNNQKIDYTNNLNLTKEEYRKVLNSELIKQKRKELKEYAVNYLGGKCIKCGYNKCISALEFHHLDPSTKEFALSDYSKVFKTKDVINTELDKCILVCANCHRELHSQ